MKRNHLPMYGVGPIYGGSVMLMTAMGIALTYAGCVPIAGYGMFRMLFVVMGAVFIILGIWLWYSAVLRARVDEYIKSNTLVTTGVYAWVRNPIYSAILLACTGILLFADNFWLLILPPVYWLWMTVLMKQTEEKWLARLHGEEYAVYCRRVNRCIPWFPKDK